jgi:hypothetical protein
MAENFDPDKFIAQTAPVGRAPGDDASFNGNPNPFDPDKFIAQTAPVGASQNGPSAIESFIHGAGDAAAMGYLPQVQATLEPGIQKILSAFLPKDPEGFNIQEAPSDYTQRRDAYIKDGKTLNETNPYSSLAGNVMGAISGGVATGEALGGVKALKLAGEGASLGQKLISAGKIGAILGAVRNPGDTEGEISPIQLGERVGNSAKDAATGAVIQGGLSGLGKIGSMIKNAAPDLEEYSQGKALKASGAMLKQFRKAFGNDKVAELGDSAMSEGIIRPGMDIHDIATNAAPIKEKIGAELGDIYRQADDAIVKNAGINKPQRMSELIDQELENMKHDIKQSVAGQRSGITVDNTDGVTGGSKNINTSSESTFPDWNEGRSAKDTLEALEKKSGAEYQRLRQQANDNLVRGYESKNLGQVPPNREYHALQSGGADIPGHLKTNYADDLENPFFSDVEKGLMRNERDGLIAKYSKPDLGVNFGDIVKESQANMAEKYKGMAGGNDVIAKVNKVLDDIGVNGITDLKTAQKVRQSLDNQINYNVVNKEVADVPRELKSLRNAIQTKIKENLGKIDETQGTNFLKDFAEKNKRYGNVTELADMALDKSARESSNAAFGLRERMSGGTGAVVGGAIAGVPGAIVGGGLGSMTTKVARQYGTPYVALVASKVASTLANNQGAMDAFSAPLLKAAQVSPKAFVTTINSFMNNPEFKKKIDTLNSPKMPRLGDNARTSP